MTSLRARLLGLFTPERRRVLAVLLASLTFRYLCVKAMIALSLWAERQPAPTLADALVDRVPYLPWMYNINYAVWIVGVAPVSLYLLFTEPARYARYSVTDGLLSLVRGLCVAVTSLGPVSGLTDPNAAVTAATADGLTRATAPVNGVIAHERQLFLTHDMFFSGHTATTFLLLLYVMHAPRLRGPMAVAHVAVVVTLVFGHMHYTIDLIGAWAVTFTLFWLREGDVRGFLRAGALRRSP